MKLCIEITDSENERLSEYIHTRYGARVHGRKTAILREALIEYLDRKSMAPPKPEKKSEKRVPEEKKSEKRKLRASIRKDPVAMAKLKQMHESGVGPFDIADALGYNRKTISGVILGLVEKGVLKKVDRDL